MQLAEVLEPYWKFKIGDVVIPVNEAARCRAERTDRTFFMERSGCPPTLTVNARHVTQCSGGIQFLYECRVWAGTESREALFHACELELLNPEEWRRQERETEKKV